MKECCTIVAKLLVSILLQHRVGVEPMVYGLTKRLVDGKLLAELAVVAELILPKCGVAQLGQGDEAAGGRCARTEVRCGVGAPCGRRFGIHPVMKKREALNAFVGKIALP